MKRHIYKPRNPESPPQAGKGQEGSSPRAFGGSVGLAVPGCGLLTSKTTRAHISVVLSHLVCGDLFWQSWDTNILSHKKKLSSIPACVCSHTQNSLWPNLENGGCLTTMGSHPWHSARFQARGSRGESRVSESCVRKC